MKFRVTVLVICIFYCNMRGTYPSCMVNPQSHFERTVTGRYVTYCEDYGFKYRNGSIKFADRCFRCGCGGCCGYGYYAGPQIVEGCETVVDGCDALHVKKQNGETVDCFSGKLLPVVNDLP